MGFGVRMTMRFVCSMRSVCSLYVPCAPCQRDPLQRNLSAAQPVHSVLLTVSYSHCEIFVGEVGEVGLAGSTGSGTRSRCGAELDEGKAVRPDARWALSAGSIRLALLGAAVGSAV